MHLLLPYVCVYYDKYLLYDVIDGLVYDLFDPLCVVLGHSLQSNAEWSLFGATVISAEETSTWSQQIQSCDRSLMGSSNYMCHYNVTILKAVSSTHPTTEEKSVPILGSMRAL